MVLVCDSGRVLLALVWVLLRGAGQGAGAGQSAVRRALGGVVVSTSVCAAGGVVVAGRACWRCSQGAGQGAVFR